MIRDIEPVSCQRNLLTIRLMAQGYKVGDYPPGTTGIYDAYVMGGWMYSGDALEKLTFETPCGILVKGNAGVTQGFWHMRTHWCAENENMVIWCPKCIQEPCNFMLAAYGYDWKCAGRRQCVTHATDRQWCYECSAEKLEQEQKDEIERLRQECIKKHSGRLCEWQLYWFDDPPHWEARYDPLFCAQWNNHAQVCQYCTVLQKEISPKKAQVYYDLRCTWTEPGQGLFEAEQKTSIEKGIKLLSSQTSRTICEAIIKYASRKNLDRIVQNKRSNISVNKERDIKLEVTNLRVGTAPKRDIMQDLQDVENGFTVIHTSDTQKTVKEQKRREKYERLILKKGADPDFIGRDEYEKAIEILGEQCVRDLNDRHLAKLARMTEEQLLKDYSPKYAEMVRQKKAEIAKEEQFSLW